MVMITEGVIDAIRRYLNTTKDEALLAYTLRLAMHLVKEP
eukprot:CAMPEP_0201285588 /NCGR_PEP_ID=MMETSP1317-20130820/113552_1 /ASSEMBLY_ACC=CAM_ASM_000770 /TAXON_ID=187299 /ORGANISM="Undescribed Undescribed, Strain Undescribed" /LENGTH=39 /DNA_ID= /DNA_START= /DNA_END= /DNA_ORIENTATION=